MKHIIIIGASSGIGQRLAHVYAQQGHMVGIAARRVQPLIDLQRHYPDNVRYTSLDVTADNATTQLDDLIDQISGLDTLIYVSGIGFNNPSLDASQDLDTARTNVLGFTRIINYAFHYFKENQGSERAHIAAVTSIAGTKGLGTSASYSASKSYQSIYLQAIDQLAHSQKVPLDITDIRPGFIDTPLLNGANNYPLLMSLDHVTPLITKAIERRKRVATIDTRWRIITWLWKHIPNNLWPHLNIHC